MEAYVLSEYSPPFELGQTPLTYHELYALGQKANPSLKIKENIFEKLNHFRSFVDKASSKEEPIYGINTGFGFLSNTKIKKEQLEELQLNIIKSHACGVGNYLSQETTRSLLILRVHTFLLGHSGISKDCVDALLKLLAHDILPLIPEQGSLGASGDLAPLAHLALGLIGEGQVCHKGHIKKASEALEEENLKPYKPKAKEGLSLLNGTQFMSTLGAYALVEAERILLASDVISALSLDALQGSITPFNQTISDIRKHDGQNTVARNLRTLFEGPDEILEGHQNCDKVQDPYSFRCIPQVHGASRDVFNFVKNTVSIDMNSVTDNPIVCPTGQIISNGNFHGQPLAMGFDFLGIAIAEIGSISECRTSKLTNPHFSGLSAFLTKNSGLESGFMIPHYVAASLVSENKVLSHPASVDTIPTSANKEDHVSMGPIAVRKLRKIIQNASHVLAIELLSSCQGLDLLAPKNPSSKLKKVYTEVRKFVPTLSSDRSMHEDIVKTAQYIMSEDFFSLVQSLGVT